MEEGWGKALLGAGLFFRRSVPGQNTRLKLAASSNHKDTSSFLRCGHLFGQGRKDLLMKAQYEALLLIGFSDDLQLVELPLAKGLQQPLRVILNDVQVGHNG